MNSALQMTHLIEKRNALCGKHAHLQGSQAHVPKVAHSTLFE